MGRQGIMPTIFFKLLQFFYNEENVLECTDKDEGRSVSNSLASIMSLVFGDKFLKASGMYFFTTCIGGKRSIDLRVLYMMNLYAGSKNSGDGGLRDLKSVCNISLQQPKP